MFGVDGIFRSRRKRGADYQRAHGLGVDGYRRTNHDGSAGRGFSRPIAGPAPAPLAGAHAPGPAPAPPGPRPHQPGPAPAPPGPTPAPPGPAPSPPTPAPSAEAITSSTVETTPAAQTRTTIGVGEEVNLTHSPGSAAWTTSVGTTPLSLPTGSQLSLPRQTRLRHDADHHRDGRGSDACVHRPRPTSVAQQQVTGTASSIL